MVLSQGPCSSPHISINGDLLQSVEKFCYLESTVNNTNSLKSEIDIRIGKAATTFGQLRPRVWSNGNLSMRVKIQVYMACVVGVLLYGYETWSTCRHQKRRLNAFHMRFLRSILGLSWRDHVRNSSVLQMTGSYDLITIIKHRRLRWAGHRCGFSLYGAPGWNLEKGPFFIYETVFNREKINGQTEVFVLLRQKKLQKKTNR